jgi:3'-phosphoadenosine 5'-phosphosulfate sulfotransferase (PAPS reductase)/FAD synthetase
MSTTPRVISNSGGRTSGYMTLLEMERGLSSTDYVIFCNTGKEREQTLRFVYQQEKLLGVPVIWLEYCRFNKWKRVSYETASRERHDKPGGPFAALLQKRKFVPNPLTRFCTQELKIRVIRDFMISQGHRPTGWINIVGIRADEPRRHANGKESSDSLFEVEHPLYHAAITKRDVRKFWAQMPFDLQLQEHEGNCDLCYLKGKAKLLDLIHNDPEEAQWWIDAEEATGGTFSKRDSYTDLRRRAVNQTTLDFWPTEAEQTLGCFCGD